MEFKDPEVQKRYDRLVHEKNTLVAELDDIDNEIFDILEDEERA